MQLYVQCIISSDAKQNCAKCAFFFPQNQLFLIFANLIDATSGTEIIHCTFNALMQC